MLGHAIVREIDGGKFTLSTNIPDVDYFSFARLPPVDAVEQPYLRVAPDLTVEILSPDESARRFASKLRFYLAHGVRLVWVVDPLTQTITAYTPGDTEEQVLMVDDTLDGGDVLPGFRVPVAQLFP